MSDKKTVRNYPGKKEYLVLSLVSKYPLYSVDTLAEELPQISRRSIQRILEKNNLSTAEKRLAYASDKKTGILSFIKKIRLTIRGVKFNFNWLKKLIRTPREKPQLNWRMVRNLGILGGLVLIFWQVISLVSAPPPEISLDQPEMNFVSRGERLFISGRVNPASSWVTVGNNNVSINGDGTFTAVIDIPMGETTLELKAVNRGKESRLVRLVRREPTEEELQAEGEKKEKKKREASNWAANIERTVNDLLAAKNAAAGRGNLLRILNNHIKDEEGFCSVVGEVMNLGAEEVSWVMITANFYNQQGGAVDTKWGFATDFGQVIEPGEKSTFETQATTKMFDHYSLELSWERGEVAGIATEAAKPATSSGETEEEADLKTKQKTSF